MKTRLITWAITLGAFLDMAYGILSENAGLLAELGLSPKVSKIIFVIGLFWTAFSKSLAPVKKEVQADDIVGDRPNDRK